MEFFTQNCSAKYHEELILLKEQSLLQPLQKVMLETSEGTIAFRKEILLLLNKLNLESQSLPNDIKEELQKIVLPLRYEKLGDFDAITLNIVSKRKKIEEKKRQYEKKKQLALLCDDSRKCTIFPRKLNCLQEAVNSLKSIFEVSQKEQVDICCNHVSLFTKLKEYQQTAEKLETDLADMQVEDLYPKKILNKYHRYLEMSDELVELINNLVNIEIYHQVYYKLNL